MSVAAVGLLIGPPPVMMPTPAPMAEIRQFQPQSSVLLADSLDDFAESQIAYEKMLFTKKQEMFARTAALEAKAAEDAEKGARMDAARTAKAEAAKAAKTAKAAEEAASRSAAKEAKEAAAAAKNGGVSAAKSSKKAGVGEVATVNRQAERIAERKAKGEAAPALF